MADEITKLLNDYHANTLWEIAQAGGLQVKDHRGKRLGKREVAAKMQAEFFTPMRVSFALKQLNERERAVLDRLLLRGGAASTKSLRRETLRAGLVTVAEESKPRGYYYRGVPYADGYAGDPTRRDSTEFVDMIARLTYQGLVFSKDAPLTSGNTPYKLQFHPGATVYVPECIRRYLPKPDPLPIQAPDWQPDEVHSGDPALLLRDLYLYWDFVRRNETPLLQSGLVGKRSLKAINDILLSPDALLQNARREDETERLFLLRLLLEQLDLVRRRQGQLRVHSEDALQIPSFWAWPAPKQIKACLDAWSGLGATTSQEEKVVQYDARLAHARRVVLAALQTLPPDAWFELEELVEEIQDRDKDFLFAARSQLDSRPSYRQYYRYGNTHHYGTPQELIERLDRHEGDFVTGCVTGFLHQLGITNVGHVGGLWKAFCLTPLGKTLLDAQDGQSPDYPARDDTGKLIVQPNFQVMAIGPVNLAWLARLDLLAEREQADRGAFAYRISRDSIYRAQQLGMDVAEVLRFLKGLNGDDLPQNVRRSLEEWGAHHERIVFRSGVSLLQAVDEGLLAQLMEMPQIGKHLARSLSPETSLLKNGRHKPLVSELVAQGLFPAVSGAHPESADHSVIVQADGVIQLIHAVPSLYLQGRLSRLAEAAPDGTWRLSASSIRRAGGSKNKVLQLLDELGKLHRGALPQEVVEQVKAWGGYYGDASAETLTLIEFRDRDALDELKTQPDLQPYLAPFPAGNRALAVVPSDELAKVQGILARLGVRLRDGL